MVITYGSYHEKLNIEQIINFSILITQTGPQIKKSFNAVRASLSNFELPSKLFIRNKRLLIIPTELFSL